MALQTNDMPRQHRIGAVAVLSGVPVSTLRVWQTRYSAFSPQTSLGKHRLYDETDVLRARLLRQLSGQGHSISHIARLNVADLNALSQRQQAVARQQMQGDATHSPLRLAVIGLPMAARIQSSQFIQSFAQIALEVSAIFDNLGSALQADMQHPPSVALIQVNTLHGVVQADIWKWLQKNNIGHAIVTYRFGPTPLIQAMQRMGISVRREPVSDQELIEIIGSLLWVDPIKAMGSAAPGGMIPQRKYNDETLSRVAAISSNILCECPQHVAEILTQLASFEQYSQECLNTSAKDAHLHAYLTSVSGSARALFEHALEMVAEHEGIAL